MKNLSVVIVSYNTRDLLKKGIQSVLPQLNPAQDELIVVDNCSTDGSADMVRSEFPSVTLLALDKDYGYAIGSNRGFEKAQGEFIVLMSSDIVFPSESLSAFLKKSKERPEAGIVCPELVDFNGSLKQLTWQWKVGFFKELLNKLFSPTSLAKHPIFLKMVPYLQRKDRSVSWVSGAVFLITKEALKRVGGFDENFQLYYEDADLCERVRRAGFSVLFAPDIKAFHGLGESMKNELSKVYLMFVQSRIYYYKKHLSKLQQFFLQIWLNWKMKAKPEYRKGGEYRRCVDHILNFGETIPLWREIHL